MNIGLPGLIVAFLVTAFAGALMISRFAFYSFKQVDAGARVRFPQIVLVPLAFVFIFLYSSDLLAAHLWQLRPVRADGMDLPKAVRRRTRGTPTPA